MVEKRKIKQPISGVITFEPEVCTGCRACELVCSLLHWGISNPSLSAITVQGDHIDGEFGVDVCNQCHFPACLYACSVGAILVDETTGARYIDDEICVKCGLCYTACPFTPDRAMIKKVLINEEETYFKCDLCRGSSRGPMCILVCPTKALNYVAAESRKVGDRVEDQDSGKKEIVDIARREFFKPH